MKAKDIAELANVSVSTVSKVLSNQSDVSQTTRSLILEIMDKVGYKPQRIIVDHQVIAFICDDPSMIENSRDSILKRITFFQFD